MSERGPMQEAGESMGDFLSRLAARIHALAKAHQYRKKPPKDTTGWEPPTATRQTWKKPDPATAAKPRTVSPKRMHDAQIQHHHEHHIATGRDEDAAAQDAHHIAKRAIGKPTYDDKAARAAELSAHADRVRGLPRRRPAVAATPATRPSEPAGPFKWHGSDTVREAAQQHPITKQMLSANYAFDVDPNDVAGSVLAKVEDEIRHQQQHGDTGSGAGLDVLSTWTRSLPYAVIATLPRLPDDAAPWGTTVGDRIRAYNNHIADARVRVPMEKAFWSPKKPSASPESMVSHHELHAGFHGEEHTKRNTGPGPHHAARLAHFSASAAWGHVQRSIASRGYAHPLLMRDAQRATRRAARASRKAWR